jgi:hypothetical protein
LLFERATCLLLSLRAGAVLVVLLEFFPALAVLLTVLLLLTLLRFTVFAGVLRVTLRWVTVR